MVGKGLKRIITYFNEKKMVLTYKAPQVQKLLHIGKDIIELLK